MFGRPREAGFFICQTGSNCQLLFYTFFGLKLFKKNKQNLLCLCFFVNIAGAEAAHVHRVLPEQAQIRAHCVRVY